jgi:hypothetical protein
MISRLIVKEYFDYPFMCQLQTDIPRAHIVNIRNLKPSEAAATIKDRWF